MEITDQYNCLASVISYRGFFIFCSTVVFYIFTFFKNLISFGKIFAFLKFK